MKYVRDYEDFCKQTKADHGHCPKDCEHPQPFVLVGVLYCGKCWHDNRDMTQMVACNKEVCGDYAI